MARSGLTAVCFLFLLFAFVTAPAGAPPKSGAGKVGAGSRQKVTDTEVTNVEREAMKCRAAADALDVYREFLAGVELTPRQKQVVEDRQKAWQDRIDRKLVKLGVEWVTIDVAKETGKRANQLIDEAFQKIKEKDFKKAASLFERAVKQDPSGVRADYYLGMLNTPNFWNYAVSAEKNFDRAHRRDPDNAAIANNLAISKVKMGKFPEAIDLWSAALRNAPEAPEVVHNLGRFAAAANNGRLAGAKTTAKRAATIFDKAVADKKGPGYDLKQGWLYTPVPLPPEERERAGAPAAADDQNPADEGQENNGKPGAAKDADAKQGVRKRPRVLVGSGTGFVIQPGYILSNRHVAQAGSSFGILLPSDPKVEHVASVVAVAGDLDLALFRCEPLAAPAVKLNGESPRRGSEIMVLGYPFSDVLVKLYADTLVFAPASTGEKKLANIFEDRTCVGCKGRSKLPCRNCFKGSITVFESSYSINGVGPGAQVLKWDTPRPKSCPGCRGAGVIDCPHCKDGSDPSLK